MTQPCTGPKDNFDLDSGGTLVAAKWSDKRGEDFHGGADSSKIDSELFLEEDTNIVISSWFIVLWWL